MPVAPGRYPARHSGVQHARTNRLLLSISVSLLSACSACIYFPQTASAYSNPAMERAHQRMSHGDYDGAVNALGEAIGFNDKDATAYLLRGECFFKLSNYKLAIQDLNNAIQYAPNNVRAYLIRGSCHASMGEDDSAITDYEGAIKLDPSLARRFFNGGGANVGAGGGNGPNTAGGGNGRPRRGRMMTRNGQTTIVEEEGNSAAGLNLHAIKDYKEAMRLVYPNGLRGVARGTATSDGNAADRDDTQAGNNQGGGGGGNGPAGGGRRRRRQGTDQAYSGGSGAVGGPLDPKQTDVQNNVGIEQDTRLAPKKNKRFVQNLDQDPNRAVFGIIPGAGEFKGDAKEAVTDFTETIRNNPNDPNTYYQRAKALQKLGRVDDALKDYNEAIQRDPQKSQYYIGRASVFYQLGKPLLSEAEITKARAVDPDVPGVVRFALPKYPPSVKWGGGDGPGGH